MKHILAALKMTFKHLNVMSIAEAVSAVITVVRTLSCRTGTVSCLQVIV